MSEANSGKASGSGSPSGQQDPAQGPSRPPRQSATAQVHMRVIRNGMSRLLSERKDMDEVESQLQNAIREMDKDIDLVQRMVSFANKARLFQFGHLRAEPVVKTEKPDEQAKLVPITQTKAEPTDSDVDPLD